MHGELSDSRPDYFRVSVGDARSRFNGRMQLAACTGIVAGGVSAKEGGLWNITDGQRGNRMAENIAICRRLWTEDDVSFAGKYRSLSGVTIKPRPVQQPCPIWIAANPPPTQSEKPMRRVAKIADGWMTVQIFPKMLGALWSSSADLREEGKDPDAFPTIAYHNININPDRNAALEESRRFLNEYYGPSSPRRWSKHGPRPALPHNAPSNCASWRATAPRRSRQNHVMGSARPIRAPGS